MLSNKVIVITGGAGLIGREFVKTVIEENGIAVIADIDEVIGNQVKIELSKSLATNNIDFVPLDITSETSIQHCIQYLSTKYNRIDALVNNAYPRNKNYGKHFFDVSYTDFCENLSVNIGGYFLCSQKFAEYFIKSKKKGNIVNIASIYGVIAPKFEIYEHTSITTPVEYAAIKSALIHLTKYMARYFKGHGIRVNSLSPGGILDDQPSEFLNAYREQCLSKGMLNKTDLTGSLLYLLSDMSAFVNGQNLVVDDGFCL